ncbi:MAG: TetR/AcrR family transcriptional regulator [Eubacteriales bacterium]|nr:TetR/AcrR family transcriptional regulator [Eubacteriales bacterium]
MKRDDIIQAAIEEFGKYDYNRASVNTIIENSETSKGTFYHYFKNKADLYLLLIQKVSFEKMKFLHSTADTDLTVGTELSIFELLRTQMEASVRFASAYPLYAMFSSKVANETNQEIRKKIDAEIGHATNEYFSELVKQNIKDKILRDDMPEEFVIKILVYMISHFNEFLLRSGIQVEFENTTKITEYLNYYVSFMEKGLGTIDIKKYA